MPCLMLSSATPACNLLSKAYWKVASTLTRRSKLEWEVRQLLLTRSQYAPTLVHSIQDFLLKLPKVKAGLEKARELYQLVSLGSREGCTLEGLLTSCNSLGLYPQHHTLADIFDTADQDASDLIDFKEFVLLLTLCHLLEPTEATAKLPQQVREALDIIEHAFQYLDWTADGLIEQNELARAIQKTSNRGWETRSTTRQLFKKLDTRKHGRLSMVDFVLGVVSLVMDEDESL